MHEPSLELHYPPAALDQMPERLVVGDPAAVTTLRNISGRAAEEITEGRSSPCGPTDWRRRRQLI